MKEHQYSDPSNWDAISTRQRCSIVASAAAMIAEAADDLVRLCASDQRTDPSETIAGELMPLCGALRFIGRRGPRILRPQRYGLIGRPPWLWGVHSTVRRVPHGRVLILGTWNYPLLLVGVQSGQALAAGNQVLVKPAIGSELATERMIGILHQAGVPTSHLQQLDSSTDSAIAAIDSGVDLIVLTGAASTGRRVLERAAGSLTPTIMELSGCDAVVVMPRADLQRTADAIGFGLNFNGGATCISPRRLIVEDSMADDLRETLGRRLLASAPATVHPQAREAAAQAIETAIARGAVDYLSHFDADSLRSAGQLRPLVLDRVDPGDAIAAADLFAPITSIIRVQRISDAVKIVNECPYRLAASIFGPQRPAHALADQLKVGTVVINDLLVPTADPRVPFGGRGQSGFGVTRGVEGLQAMTVPHVIGQRRGKLAPHLTPRKDSDFQTLMGALQLLYAGSLGQRLKGLRQILSAQRGSQSPKAGGH